MGYYGEEKMREQVRQEVRYEVRRRTREDIRRRNRLFRQGRAVVLGILIVALFMSITLKTTEKRMEQMYRNMVISNTYYDGE